MVCFCSIKSRWTCSDSYTGRDDFFRCFFFGKSLESCSGSNLLFRGLIFKVTSFPLLRGGKIPLSFSESVKVTKNVIGF